MSGCSKQTHLLSFGESCQHLPFCPVRKHAKYAFISSCLDSCFSALFLMLLTDFYWDASCDEKCLSLVRCFNPGSLTWLGKQILNDFKLCHSNNKLYGTSVWPFFRTSLPLLFLASAMPAMPLLIGYGSFMGFWPFCLSLGVLMPKISDIHFHFFQPVACLCQLLY